MDPLISTAELARRLDEVTVLDVRYRLGGPPGAAEFDAGHLPGAAYVDLDADLAAPPGEGGRHPLPDALTFAAAMRRAGVRADRPVVAYDDWAGRAAARACWLLHYHGHEDVRVLDGGWSAWRADGGATETGAGSGEPGDFRPRPDGRFRSAAELAAVYAEVGATPGADVAAYCGSGVTAAHDLLALARAGIDAALYPGSWSGWITDPRRPIER